MTLTHSYLTKCFCYNQEIGEISWKQRPLSHFLDERSMKKWNTRYSGKIVRTKHNQGYIMVSIDKKKYLLHRIIWFLKTGELPKKEIDHINGIKIDNSWKNLREATRSENLCNRTKQSNNTTGYKGVFKNRKRFMAKVGCNYKQYYLGCFDTIEEALYWYNYGANYYHQNFARIA